ncbi:MAG: SUMF1/EgtB/PvdO family nonheme iron enzyme [candidate division KSB1 bacterium]|nr:SUMF1/EgtB/PvdO family nonheme iron enzyme [candidate division KSB1 bacterium]
MDMAGNVWEWCADWFDRDKDSRVVRGGSWFVSEDLLACSVRYGGDPGYRGGGVGFRVACGA